MHPYNVTAMQQLLPIDYGHRLQHWEWFNNHLNNDDILNICLTEHRFHLSLS